MSLPYTEDQYACSFRCLQQLGARFPDEVRDIDPGHGVICDQPDDLTPGYLEGASESKGRDGAMMTPGVYQHLVAIVCHWRGARMSPSRSGAPGIRSSLG